MIVELERIRRKAERENIDRTALEALTRTLVAVMLAEVSDWRSLISAHGLNAV